MAKQEVSLTKYEEARLIGSRSLQLAMGAPPLVNFEKLRKEIGDRYLSPVDLAKLEYSQELIPMHVVNKTMPA